MTASRTGLAILAAIAVALAVVLVAAGGRDGAVSRAPFADLGAGAGEHTLTWDRPGQPPVVITGSDQAGWRMTAPSAGPADGGVIADVLASVRGARWQRRASAAPGAARLGFVVDGHRLELGPDVAGAGGWIRAAGWSYLVDSWVLTAIDRDAVALRVRSPVSIGRDQVAGLEIHGPVELALAGPALDLTTTAGPIRLRPEVVDALLDAIAALRVEALVGTGAQAGTPWETIRVRARDGRGEEVLLRGPCPGPATAVWVGGSAGEVCVAQDALARLDAAAHVIVASPLAVADPRPVASPPLAVTLSSGAELRWRGAAVEVRDPAEPATARGADDDAVARVVAALTAAASVVMLPSPRPAARATIAVTTAAGAETLELLGDDLVARTGAPVGYRIGRDAIAALALAAPALRDRLLWRSEPSLLTGLTVTGGGIVEVVPVEAAWARAVADALATPRVVGFAAAAGGSPRRTIELTYAPPPTAGAAPEVHRIELGRGCAAVADGEGVILDPALCRLLAGPTGSSPRAP